MTIQMKTRITDMLGIRYPIIQGGMQWVGRAELASAVSNAGGLGILTALTQPEPDALAAEIDRCRQMTDQPFGVNLTILPKVDPPPYEEYLDVVIKQGVKVLETAGRSPVHFVEKANAAGISIIHKCTAVRHGLSAERGGVSAISIDGFECAGHPGEDDVGGLVLFPAAARKIKIPLVASGGIGDGRAMAAAMVLGCEGVNLGTRFCAVKEAPIHQNIKQALVDASERDTTLILRNLRNTGRVLKNDVSSEINEIEGREGGSTFDDIAHLAAGTRGRQTLESGQAQDGLVWAGQVVGVIDDIPSCAELIDRMVRECQDYLSSANRVFA